jgi:5-dehydro-4-deoxyglucarate dehydratase
MKAEEFKSHVQGVIAFCPTFFTDTDEVDRDAIERHVDFLCGLSINSIVVCGGVGEFYSLEPGEHSAVVKSAVAAADGRLPVIAGIGHSTRIACGLAESAAAAEASGLMINPLYYVDASAAGVCRHYIEIARASHLGCIVYHSNVWPYDLGQLLALTEIESVVGLKDEVGDLAAFATARSTIAERFVWINGMGELLAGPYVAAGAGAMTSGLVNFVPWLTLQVWKTAITGRREELNTLVEKYVRPIAELRQRRPGNSITVVKEAMSLRDLASGHVRLPLVALQDDEREELSAALTAVARAEADAVVGAVSMTPDR